MDCFDGLILKKFKYFLRRKNCSKQRFDTANQRFSELAAAQKFFSDVISGLN